MPYIEDETGDFETWQNPGKGRVQVVRLDGHGKRSSELIGPGRRFQLTPRERRMNQEMAANDKLDIFSNGTVVPLSFADKSPDADQMNTNPNFMKDDEISAFFKIHIKTFEKRVNEIGNLGLITRLIDASQEDNANATVNQVAILKKRMIELDPSLQNSVENIQPPAGSAKDGMGQKPVTPK